MTISYTLWPSLYDVSTHTTVTDQPWPDFVLRFTNRTFTTRKDAVGGFGPYVLRPGGRRRDADVLHLTAAVFDTDLGDAVDVVGCADRLADAGFAHLWYTTHSHNPSAGREAHRLVIPFAEPIGPERWPGIRRHLLETFHIPADPAKCSAPSHFYFLPSSPPDAAEYGSFHFDGPYYEPPDLPAPPPSRRLFEALVEDATIPEEPDEAVDLAAVRTELTEVAKRYARRFPEKAALIRKVLAGEELAEHGSRNTTTLRAAGIVAWALPGRSVGTVMAVLRPSVTAMVAAGSSLRSSEVERMVRTAVAERAAHDAAERRFKEALREFGQRHRG